MISAENCKILRCFWSVVLRNRTSAKEETRMIPVIFSFGQLKLKILLKLLLKHPVSLLTVSSVSFKTLAKIVEIEYWGFTKTAIIRK